MLIVFLTSALFCWLFCFFVHFISSVQNELNNISLKTIWTGPEHWLVPGPFLPFMVLFWSVSSSYQYFFLQCSIFHTLRPLTPADWIQMVTCSNGHVSWASHVVFHMSHTWAARIRSHSLTGEMEKFNPCHCKVFTQIQVERRKSIEMLKQ